MRIIIILVLMFLLGSSICSAELWRYTDKATGEERGICYSDKPIENPNWNSSNINESDKEYFLKLQQAQMDSKPKTETDLQKLTIRVEALEKKVGI